MGPFQRLHKQKFSLGPYESWPGCWRPERLSVFGVHESWLGRESPMPRAPFWVFWDKAGHWYLKKKKLKKKKKSDLRKSCKNGTIYSCTFFHPDSPILNILSHLFSFSLCMCVYIYKITNTYIYTIYYIYIHICICIFNSWFWCRIVFRNIDLVQFTQDKWERELDYHQLVNDWAGAFMFVNSLGSLSSYWTIFFPAKIVLSGTPLLSTM